MAPRIGDIRFIGHIPKGTRLLVYEDRMFLAHPEHPLKEVVIDRLTGDGRIVEVPAALQATSDDATTRPPHP